MGGVLGGGWGGGGSDVPYQWQRGWMEGRRGRGVCKKLTSFYLD